MQVQWYALNSVMAMYEVRFAGVKQEIWANTHGTRESL